MERRLWPASSSAWTVACRARTRLAVRSAMESPPSPRAAPVRRPPPRDRGPGREATGGGGRQPARRPGRGRATHAGGRRPAPPVVPRLWRPLRRTAHGPGRRPRSRVASPDMRPGWTPPGQAPQPPADGLDLDEHRAVEPPFAHGVLINTHHPRGRDFQFGQCTEQPQHRAATDGHPEHPYHPGAGPAGDGETTAARADRNRSVRPPCRRVSLGICSANVNRAHEDCGQKNRRTRSCRAESLTRHPAFPAAPTDRQL
jgi:hypothetical protein